MDVSVLPIYDGGSASDGESRVLDLVRVGHLLGHHEIVSPARASASSSFTLLTSAPSMSQYIIRKRKFLRDIPPDDIVMLVLVVRLSPLPHRFIVGVCFYFPLPLFFLHRRGFYPMHLFTDSLTWPVHLYHGNRFPIHVLRDCCRDRFRNHHPRARCRDRLQTGGSQHPRRNGHRNNAVG